MSAIAALKGYRTQFLYSLYYILSNKDQPYSYRLEGEEDLDVLDERGHILYAIQVKNLSRSLTLADLVARNKTSFLNRFLGIYPKSTPVLVSFGAVSEDLKKWKNNANHKDVKEQNLFAKAGITNAQISLIKEKVQFIEITEESITEQILELLKEHKSIDPLPTAENLLYYIQYTAEKQQLITAHELLETIERMGIYLSERIAYANQYGIYIKPLVKNDLSQLETEMLKEEFYFGVSARYEHIYSGLDVAREHFLKLIDDGFGKHNVLVIHGASGQGKSTLAYRYLFNSASQTLIYELNLQEDPVKTNEAIVAISALTKGLKVPVFFVLHVTANTTSWLKIAREFANHSFLRLVVTVRNEDWFRAQSAEIDFLHTAVELELAEEEAEVIFERLEGRRLIKTYVDFKDAWVELKAGVPLLEFTHAITQGSSLKDKLKGQLAQLNIEETERAIGQLTLLRTICLADAFGARIDAKLTTEIPNIKLIIDKFEKEYLIKHSSDRKYLSGLHPIRSMLLVELLFDEFVVCKKDYVASCLKIIEQEDAYSFILQVLYHRIISTEELIFDLKSTGRNSWMFYGAATKSLLWSGIRDYIDQNAAVLNEVYEKTGDAWSVVTDIYHGDVFDLEKVLSSLPTDNDSLMDYFRGIKQRLSAKSDVYGPVIKLFDQLDIPPTPKIYSEWEVFAETIFWLSQTENKSVKIDNLTIDDFQKAFSLLDTQALALLMLGMHYYSDKFNGIRLDLAPIFNGKVREEYHIPLLLVDDEIRFDFVVNMKGEEKTGGLHKRTIEIIDLLRTAYPEKTAFKSQGHGHHVDMVPMPNDESTKHIPAKNLPLAQWVNINANLRRLFDFQRRPDDWLEFYQRLEQWEQDVKTIFLNFRNSFTSYRKLGSFAELVPVMKQMYYQALPRLAAPKSAVDPLGIPVVTKGTQESGGKNGKENKEVYLSEKYKPFFDSYNEYKSSIENFIRQSGEACYDIIRKKSDSDHNVKENILRVSFINLYDAAAHRVKFEEQREQFFKKFGGNTTVLGDSDLFGAATIWKSFRTAIQINDQERIILSEGISGLKNDFINSLSKSIKNANRNANYKIIYRNDPATHNLPIFITQVNDPLESILALRDCYNLMFQCVNQTEYTSLKYMMLQRYFPKIYIISEISGYVLDIKWLEFPLHLFLKNRFEELPAYRFMPKDIETEIASNLKLKSWLFVHPNVQIIQDLATGFANLQLYIGHLADLKFFDHNEKLDEKGNMMIRQYVEEVGDVTNDTWNQLFSKLTDLGANLPEDLAEIASEDEKEYWILLLDIMNELVPQTSGGKMMYFDMVLLQQWSAKLAELNEKWGLFIILLQRKVLLAYEAP